MPIKYIPRNSNRYFNIKNIRGVTLIELIVFLVVVSIALVAVLKVFNFGAMNSIDPIMRTKAIELAQARLDDILSRKFDENTPTGGVPACNSTGGASCLGITVDSDFDDIGDYQFAAAVTQSEFVITSRVVNAGSDLGLSNDEARLVTVNVSIPVLHSANNASITLSAYKVNY